jgi:hypothetical protein
MTQRGGPFDFGGTIARWRHPYINEDALTRIQPDAQPDEPGFLNAFDSNRDLICSAAAKVYVRGSRGSDDHNPAPRIAFGKQNVCAAAFQRRAPSKRSLPGGGSFARDQLGAVFMLSALRSRTYLGHPYAGGRASRLPGGCVAGTALETPSGATSSKPGPVSISGKAAGCEPVPRRALTAGGPYRLTSSYRPQQK